METEREEAVDTAVVETGEAGITPAVETAAEEVSAAIGTEDLAKVRELVLAAHPEVVPDLVRGSSIDELIASVEPAKSAYDRIAERVRAGVGAQPATAEGPQSPAVAQPPTVPAGGASNVVDPGTLSPTTKIAQGLAQHKSR